MTGLVNYILNIENRKEIHLFIVPENTIKSYCKKWVV